MSLPAVSFTSVLTDAEKDTMDGSQEEEILLDENAEAARFDFYMVGGLEPSPNHKLLAYAEDTSGNEKFTLHVKDITTGREILKEPIKVICCRRDEFMHKAKSELPAQSGHA